jgi:exopolysaccharide production protein ExoZ
MINKKSYPFTGPAVANDNEIVGIQAMRFIAATAVLVDHFVSHFCESGRLPMTWLPVVETLGYVGVCLFFAISGFVMMLTNRGKFASLGNSADFFIRRLIRIWPMYCIATLTIFTIKFGKDSFYTLDNLVRSLFFIPYISDGGLYRPILGKGWTLNYEMFFYVIFAACLIFKKRTGLLMSSAMLIMLALYEGAVNGEVVAFYANRIVLFFAVGMLLATLVKDTRIPWPHQPNAGVAIGISCTIFSLVFLVYQLPIHLSVQIAAALVLIFFCLYFVCFSDTRLRNPRLKHVVLLCGDSSYVLYLFHGFVFVALSPIINRLHFIHPFAILLAAGFLAVLACIAIHLLLEKPTNKLLIAWYRSARLTRAQCQVAQSIDPK